MIEVSLPESVARSEATTFAACLATILELPYEEVPTAGEDEDVAGWRTMRWLGGRGLGLVPIAGPDKFSWAGPWIGLVRQEQGGATPERPARSRSTSSFCSASSISVSLRTMPTSACMVCWRSACTA